MKSEDKVAIDRRSRIVTLDFDKQKFAYEMRRKELEHRRDKAWRMFSWASTILLGTVAGMVAIVSRSQWNLPC